MKNYEVKFQMRPLSQEPTIQVYAVAAPTADKARAIAWGLLYSDKPSNGAKAKILSVTAIKAS